MFSSVRATVASERDESEEYNSSKRVRDVRSLRYVWFDFERKFWLGGAVSHTDALSKAVHTFSFAKRQCEKDAQLDETGGGTLHHHCRTEILGA
jgi:hypothetical protein